MTSFFRESDPLLPGRVAALAQEALELAREHVAGRQLRGIGAALLLVRGPLELLHERLHVWSISTARETWRSYSAAASSSSAASTVIPIKLSNRRSSASEPFGFGTTAT